MVGVSWTVTASSKGYKKSRVGCNIALKYTLIPRFIKGKYT